MRRKRTIAIWILAAAGFAGLQARAAEDGFIPLFNGKDLAGWAPVGTPEAFTVREGAIYSTGAPPYPSWLRTVNEYENFVFRFEYKTPGWYEGGVLFHAPLRGPASKLGFKLHLRHDKKPYGARSPGAIYDVAAPLAFPGRPPGEWNECEVEVNWPRLRVRLNGMLIHDIDMSAEEALKYRLRRGYIGIQNIGGRAYFRNLRIKPLPDGGEQWTNLLAKGIGGFETHGDAVWAVRHDTLIGAGNNGVAVTKQTFEGPFELQVWVKTIVNGNGGVLFYHDGKKGVEVQCFNTPDSTNPTGSIYGIAPAARVAARDEEWYLMQIFADGPRAMVLVNGEKVAETRALKPPYEGRIGFQLHTPASVIHYRGARIRNASDVFSRGG